MNELFGGSLVIKDGFSSAFTSFSNSISKASNSFNLFNNSIGQSERANRQATQNMKQQITDLAETYVKQGDKVKKGDLLIYFDKEAIVKEGYSLDTPILVTNTKDYLDIVVAKDSNSSINAGEDLIVVL